MSNQNLSAPIVLSRAGSGRATAYQEHHKIITVGQRTHVAWLDAGQDGFWVRGRTLDRATGEWGAVITIGEAQDNHGGPALTVDGEGYLHILYYPHHAQFRYRRSTRPNDLSAWGPEIRFGEELSYPTMLCGPDGTLYLTARRGHGYHTADGRPEASRRMDQEFWQKPVGGDWQRRAVIIRSRHPGYANFYAALAWGPDHKTLHLSSCIYETSPIEGAAAINTVGYMKSADGGATWMRADGSPIALPATAESIDVLADGRGPAQPYLYSGPLAVASKGVPHLIYSAETSDSIRLYLAQPAPGLGWTRRDLSLYLPPKMQAWDVTLGMGGGLTFDESGRATIVAVAHPHIAGYDRSKTWGHPSTEVVQFWSDDGLITFQSKLLSPLDAGEAHWLPNIERSSGHNRVPDPAGIIYTEGGAGDGLVDLDLNNRVIWRPAN